MEGRRQGRFRKQMSLMDMTLVGIGAIIGSGWLFAAGLVASIAGPAGWISWLIGGIALLQLGLVYAELGAAFPRAGRTGPTHRRRGGRGGSSYRAVTPRVATGFRRM